MSGSLEDEVKSTRGKLADLIGAVKVQAHHADEMIGALWQTAGQKLSGLDSRLDEATENLSHTGDEARLQAHLALMEVKTAWQAGSKAMDAIAQRSARAARTQFDHAAVQTHLGKMEVESYIEGPGRDLIKRFKHAKQQVELESAAALREMGKHMDDIAQHMRREV
jgi:hypothetical protein